MSKYLGVDYFSLADLLSDEEKLVQESIRDFVSADVIPVIEEHYQNGTFPRELVSKLGELGVFGIT